jgi:4-amino-4-deoxy-L-arabinose transferase-like glycosyltransferase
VTELREKILSFVRPAPWAAFLVLLFVLANIVGWLLVGIHTDEAYYWVWSQRLAWSYFDHPPAVAWTIRLFTSILGDHGWSLRLPAVVSWFVSATVVYRMARAIYPDSGASGLYALLVFASLPLTQIGFHIVTPDAPLMMFTALALELVYRAHVLGRRDLWVYAGLASGAALLSKYNGVFLPPTVFLALVFSASGRRELRHPWPWLAGILAALLFVPVILWNYQHDWVSFRFQLHHGVTSHARSWWYNLSGYVATQLATALPWTLVAMAVAAVQSRRQVADDFARALLIAGFAVPMLFFAATGLAAVPGANWTAMAYLPGSILLGGALSNWLAGARGRLWHWPVLVVIVASVVSLGLANLLRYPLGAIDAGINILPRNTQITFTYGWPKLGAAVRAVYGKQQQIRECRILIERHTLAAEVSLQLDDVQGVVVPTGARMNQYAIWNQSGRYNDGRPFCVYIRYARYPDKLPARITVPKYGKWTLDRKVELVAPEYPRWYGIYVPVLHGRGSA